MDQALCGERQLLMNMFTTLHINFTHSNQENELKKLKRVVVKRIGTYQKDVVSRILKYLRAF